MAVQGKGGGLELIALLGLCSINIQDYFLKILFPKSSFESNKMNRKLKKAAKSYLQIRSNKGTGLYKIMNDVKEISVELIGFQEEIANIQTAIADFESGQKLNIAVIAEPFAGRTALLDAVEKMNPQKVTRLSFSSVVKNKIMLPDSPKRIILIDDCQFLYTRKIGGFDVLDDFLELVSSSNYLFITSWNLYSWRYQDEVMNIGRYFPIQVSLSKFTAAEIKENILSKYKPDEIKFVEDVEFEKEKIIEVAKYPLSLRLMKKSITFNIPFLKINFGSIKFKFGGEEKVAIEDIIFENILHASNGNPGVAQVVWQKSLEYPVIKPGRIKEFAFNIDLDYTEAFVLSIILSMKSIKKEELAEIAEYEHTEEILFRLVKQGLVAIEEGRCSIKPEALKSTVDFLKRLRLVW